MLPGPNLFGGYPPYKNETPTDPIPKKEESGVIPSIAVVSTLHRMAETVARIIQSEGVNGLSAQDRANYFGPSYECYIGGGWAGYPAMIRHPLPILCHELKKLDMHPTYVFLEE